MIPVILQMAAKLRHWLEAAPAGRPGNHLVPMDLLSVQLKVQVYTIHYIIEPIRQNRGTTLRPNYRSLISILLLRLD